jgi:hypothetical protein
MAVELWSWGYTALRADAKPGSPVALLLLETDTGILWQYNGAAWLPAANPYDANNSNVAAFWDNFDTINPAGVSTANPYNYTWAASGTGSGVSAGGDSTDGGAIMQVIAGTANGNYSTMYANNVRLLNTKLLAFAARVRLNEVPSGGAIESSVGAMLSPNSSGQVDGIYFRTVSGGNWFFVCRSGGSETTRDLGVAPAAGTYFFLEFRISGSGTSVQAYLNGAATGAAITTNIPTAALIPAMRDNCRGAGATARASLRNYGWGWRYTR